MKRGTTVIMEEQAAIAAAIQAVRSQVRWKPHKDIRHLEKRKALGHLPATGTQDDYNNLITAIVNDEQNLVYVYEFAGTKYAALRGSFGDQEWLVLFGLDGIMERAFPPDDVDGYLTCRGFRLVGKIEEVLR